LKLADLLAHKPLFYTTFDPQRIWRAYRQIEGALRLPPLVHIVGTNGKGSTGRFLAGGLREAGLRVGHYTSPHIFRFNERIWIDGADVEDSQLEGAHQRLLALLPRELVWELSYFEYTTLLAMVLFEDVEIAVVEAGLGGEFDATAPFPKVLTLVTTIDYDHQAFLGSSIQEIATTKLNAIQTRGIVGEQIHDEVVQIARNYPVQFLDQGAIQEGKELAQGAGLPPFFGANLALALEGARVLGTPIDPQKALEYRLRGRMERHANLLIDVGHNPLSARELVKLLPPATHLVYNSYEDKPYDQILSILAPKLAMVEILPIRGEERIVQQERLERTIEALGLPWRPFEGLQKGRFYCVYGSFRVVEEFFKGYGSEILRVPARAQTPDPRGRG